MRRSALGSLFHCCEFRFFTVTADPRIGPIRGQFLAFGNEIAPRVAYDHVIGLPHDVELAVSLHLADENRLGQVVVGVHHSHAARKVREFLAIRGWE